jgi:hypothetical protein
MSELILKEIRYLLIIFENKYPQSCHASRAFTRAGFESAPLNAPLKLFRAIL